MKNNLLPLINAIAPSHSRTSCSDLNSNGNEYFNEFGCPRCQRCALLYFAAHGKWMYEGLSVDLSLRFTGHPRIIETPPIFFSLHS
jgi:hypothetical protein